MEQDIKKLKEKINNIKKYDTYRYDWTETDVQTVEHLIKAYKELEELYKSEKKMKNQYVELYQDVLLKENVIPVSLVEETIEEYEEKAKRIAGTYQYADSGDDLENKKKQVIELRTKSEVLQELLERRK